MSTGLVYQFIDFSNGSGGDTGEAEDAESILPLLDGQDLDESNIGRGPENLRQRTEVLRDALFDSMYLQDADRSGLCLSGPGTVAWGGSTTAAGTGVVTLSDNLYLLPFLTPGNAQTPPVPPVASQLGSLTLQRVGVTPGIVVTSALRTYYQGNEITVTVVPGSVYGIVLVDGFRSIIITATASTMLSTVITDLNALQTTIPSTTTIVTAVLAGGAAGTDLLLQTQAKQFVSGNVDAEAHTLTPAAFASFFATVGNRLAEGDTLCVAYAANTFLPSDPTPLGGRRQSIPENTNTSIPVGSLFNSRVAPASLVNALPICKVINNRLIFIDGSSLVAGASGITLGGGVDPATATSLGIVQLTYAAGVPGAPAVAPQDANGTINNTATAAAAPGLIGTGAPGSGPGVKGFGGSSNGSGVHGVGTGAGFGVVGVGGSSNGPGVVGDGGATNGDGVQGNGTGSGNGVKGVGGATAGPGVLGTGGTNGMGVSGTGNGTGAGGDFTGGASGPAVACHGFEELDIVSSAPATPATDKARVYLISNGGTAGVTKRHQLVVMWQDGTTTVIAESPILS